MYDVAIVNAGLGGLFAAALLSQRKKKVLVYTSTGMGYDAFGGWSADGFHAQPGPALAYGFEDGGELQLLFQELTLDGFVPRRTERYQVALPDSRITVHARREDTLEELHRELPGDAPALVALYDALDRESEKNAKSAVSRFFSRQRSGIQFLRKFSLTEKALTFYDVQSRLLCQKPLSAIPLSTLTTLCQTQPFLMHDAYRNVADRLVDRILRNGGEVRYAASAPELTFQGNRISAIRTEQDEFTAHWFLLGRHDRHMVSRHFGIRSEAVPVGMSDHVFCLADYTRPADLFSLSLSREGDPATAPQGMRTLTALFYGQTDPVLDDRVVYRVGTMVPFLNDFVVVLSRDIGADEVILPESLAVKPVRSAGVEPLLFRSARKNLYVLNIDHPAPQGLSLAVRKFVLHIGM